MRKGEIKMTIRERIEQQEEQTLSKYATLAKNTKGRATYQKPCDIRTEFQRDRDRILHCKAFKRLRYKTQVFLSPDSDHYLTRLVHTLEVAQIARTIARGLRINEDLTEAIALGHDLGHTPFGHAGERVLNEICPHKFHHAENSVRVVTVLEKEGKGLNLTMETLDGIRNHSFGHAQTLEGRLVKIADKVAYINHDIEDAIRAGVLTKEDLPQDCIEVLGDTKSKRITTIATSILEYTKEDIAMAPEVLQVHNKLRKFMFEHVYLAVPAKQAEEAKAVQVVEQMYHYYLTHEKELPEFYRQIAQKEDLHRAVCDYISGMSDHYIVERYLDLFVPHSWKGLKQ